MRPSEQLLFEGRIAGAWALERMVGATLIGLLVWGGLALVTYYGAPNARSLLLPVAALLLALQLTITVLYVWRRLATTEYVVTDEAVYARRGQILLSVSAAALDRVTDLYVHTSLVGRLFGFSGLWVKTAGGGIHLAGLRDAYRVRASIQDARHTFLTRLLAESGRPTPGPREAGQCQCPNCQLVFPVPPARPLDVECPRCRQRGTLFAEAAV